MRTRRPLALVALIALASSTAPAAAPPCPEGMAAVDARACIDRWEASIELVDEGGHALGLHPSNRPFAVERGRAVSRAGVLPQAHVSRTAAAEACAGAGKRLCTAAEWGSACRGAVPTRWPYGPRFRSGACNDEGVSPMPLLFGPGHAYDDATMNDPRLDRVAGTVARTGGYQRCTSGNGVYDLVGNLHEWTAEPSGVFRGGYFLDTKSLGEGCAYETTGHAPDYRDYSTGFRCCADRGP